MGGRPEVHVHEALAGLCGEQGARGRKGGAQLHAGGQHPQAPHPPARPLFPQPGPLVIRGRPQTPRLAAPHILLR